MFKIDAVRNSAEEEPDFKETDWRPLTLEEATSGKASRPVRIYATGIFDLWHPGHARLLKQCKMLFPNVHLIAGTCNDALTHKKKGQTVNTQWERYENISHCRYVDELFTDIPWVTTVEYMDKYHFDFLAHDDAPYASSSDASSDIYKPLKDAGRFVATQRTTGVSTSDIITRVVKHYDTYICRQLKRGVAHKDLNITKEQGEKSRAKRQKMLRKNEDNA